MVHVLEYKSATLWLLNFLVRVVAQGLGIFFILITHRRVRGIFHQRRAILAVFGYFGPSQLESIPGIDAKSLVSSR